MNHQKATRWNGYAIMTDTEQTAPESTTMSLGFPAGHLPAILAVACWVFVLGGNGTGMSVWSMTRLNLSPVTAMSAAPHTWTPDYAVQMILMWWVMMLAMMFLPLAIQLYRSGKSAPPITTVTFLSAYALVWLLFSTAASFLQWCLEQVGLLHPFMMWSISPTLSALVLIGAGLFQLLPFKSRARSNCNPDKLSLKTGFQLGCNCLLSKAPLMLVFFAGGIMNLVWMICLTLIVLIERVYDITRSFDRLLAVLLIGLGVWSFFS
ncbi:putative metal-binding integral membrane protein [Roseibium album]|nr:putative metal-binding integral membrane protein [Roseibium album]